MWNAGDAPARMIEIISPAGFENFFKELTELLEAGPPDPSRLGELGELLELGDAQSCLLVEARVLDGARYERR